MKTILLQGKLFLLKFLGWKKDLDVATDQILRSLESIIFIDWILTTGVQILS